MYGKSRSQDELEMTETEDRESQLGSGSGEICTVQMHWRTKKEKIGLHIAQT